MKATLIGMALVAYCAFWFGMAQRAVSAGDPGWMPLAILALVALPGLLGIALGYAIAERSP